MKKEKSEDFTAIVISKLQTKPKFNSYKDLFIAALCVKKMDISTLYSFLKHGFLGLGENELIFFISLIWLRLYIHILDILFLSL